MFGNEVTVEQARAMQKRREPIPSGYAFQPGTGPSGETCGSCRHLVRIAYSKTYLKCELARRLWTRGRKTDVLARAPSCKFWEAPPLPAQDAAEPGE